MGSGVGMLIGGVLGCGVGAPLGSVVGAALNAAAGKAKLAGMIWGSTVGGITGGGLGVGIGFGVGAVTAKHQAGMLRSGGAEHTLTTSRRIFGAIPRLIPGEAAFDAFLNRLPFRGRLLAFVLGAIVGSGGLTGVILQWRDDATKPLSPLADAHKEKTAPSQDSVLRSGFLQRWVWFSPWLWFPHWRTVQVQLRPGLLLVAPKPTSAVDDPQGRTLALPLAGACVSSSSSGVEITLSSGEREYFRPVKASHEGWKQEEWDKWCCGLAGVAVQPNRRLVLDFPSSWQQPCTRYQLVPLDKGDPEYKHVAHLASQRPASGVKPWVQGKLRVTGVSRVQSPKVWDRYQMRRSMIAAENDGDPNEECLWHGTRSADKILTDGFDPRVCSLNGLFGGGVYFADEPYKSVRYCGKGKQGNILLCRVALGNPLLKRLGHSDLRRPPDPIPIFPTHVGTWLRSRRFHSVFYSAQHFPFLLEMNEYIVYHTNQAYPDYLVSFVLE